MGLGVSWGNLGDHPHLRGYFERLDLDDQRSYDNFFGVFPIGQSKAIFCCGWRGQGPPYHRGVGGSFEKKILMFFKNKKVRFFFNFTVSFRIVSENDCQ